MIPRSILESASGVRPAGAFLSIFAVLALATVQVARTTLTGEERCAENVVREVDPAPAYRIVDRQDRPLARFVQRLDLILSPRSMWQAHTPDHMARRMSEALGGEPAPQELLRRFLPDAEGGVVRLFAHPLRAADADAVENWLEAQDDRPAVDGVWLEDNGGDGWILCWEPSTVLSRPHRARHDLERDTLGWSRRLADGLARAWPDDPELFVDTDATGRASARAIESRRDAIWRRLMPDEYELAVIGFDGDRSADVVRTLREEGVADHQMRVERARDRCYPSGRFELLGGWGFVGETRAEYLARAELGLTAEQRVPAGLQGRMEREVNGILARRHPRRGLEKACDRLLDRPEWKGLGREPAGYAFLRNRPARRRGRAYYLASWEGSDPLLVGATIDGLLQQQVGVHLERLMEEHRPALCMALVLDVASGDVLAVDVRSDYELGSFAPVTHTFTPGSTFKALVMASALDEGVVRPDETFDVGHGEYPIGNGRVIHEAESSRTGINSAAECLAHSINAGMVQVGLRVPPERLRERLVQLGYGTRPRSDLGGERPGYVRPLPWKRHLTHASVCFGHELLVTLWQHAAGLAAIVRGGTWRPLRLLRDVSQGEHTWPLPELEGRRVFSERTCEDVREMMRLGALEGTGSRIPGVEPDERLWLGTKTGTAEKVPTEICVHVELADQERHAQSRTSCSKACRRSLVGQRPGHRRCYTSSMCAFGSLAGAPERELMVLVVADEPRGREKYGSRVAGPTAVAILREALGITRLGMSAVPNVAPGFASSSLAVEAGGDQPWAEEPEPWR